MDRTATIVFTRKNIEDFCVLTGDTNPIHNAEYMLNGERPKEPIIPGMMLFAHILSGINSRHIDNLSQINLYFNRVNCSNQQITYSLIDGEFPEALFKINEDSGGERETARFFLSPKTSVVLQNFSNGKSSVLLQAPENYGEFKRITGMENLTQGDFIYTLCSSSAALLDRVKMPGTKEEEEIRNAMSQGERSRLPVYNSIHAIFEPDAYSKVDRKNPLCFSSSMSKKPILGRDGKPALSKRDYVFGLECKQKEVLYKAKFDLTLVPERMLRAGVVDCVENLQQF